MLTQRSQEKELMDLGPDYYSQAEYEHCLKKLFRINQLLGFFSSTVQFLKKYPKETSVLDIGCGGGLFLLHLGQRLPLLRLVGVDVSPEAIAASEKELQAWRMKNPNVNVSFQLQKQANLTLPENSFDVLMSTLVCHHLTDDELIEFFPKALATARSAVLINDLHRHPCAEFFYRIISPFFRNRLITHDGLISIRRGFTRKEWVLLLQKANIKNYKIEWLFPFRWRVILWKD
jgi:SAM-dependent methyltransferase